MQCAMIAASAASAALFFHEPMPLEMPQAESYLVVSNGAYRLEDRYDSVDLWTSQTVCGRWIDADGRVFMLARIDSAPPDSAVPVTRAFREASKRSFPPDDEDARDSAVAALSPVNPAEVEPYAPRVGLNGWKILYYQRRDDPYIACAFLPKGRGQWYFALWELVPGDVCDDARTAFETRFLASWDDVVETFLPAEAAAARAEKARRRDGGGGAGETLPERELLRRDVRHAVANYARWRCTDGPDFSVVDDLGGMSGFVAAFTNDLAAMRKKYASVMPSPVDASGALCVARIFRDRGEYVDALGANGHGGMEWSAAYWSPSRREIVAHLPEAGEKKLLRTLRHEAFHQYLSYACSMIPASPWINEGYAQYFEDFDSAFRERTLPADADVQELSKLVEPLLFMDYAEFYAGSDEERALKYALARSIAVFIEEGAPAVAREPFRNIKSDYMAALLRTRDMRKATSAAFGESGLLARFAAEWAAFWSLR